MLQHETGHLDGFLYVDRLIGRHARAAKKTVKKQRLGCARAVLDAGRGSRSVRSLSRCVELPPVGPGSACATGCRRVGAPADRRDRPPASRDPTCVVRTKSGELVEIAPPTWWRYARSADAPVRTSEIRTLEHAAALAWPGPNSSGSTAGCCGPAAATPAGPTRLCRLTFSADHRRAARDHRLVCAPRADPVAGPAGPVGAGAGAAGIKNTRVMVSDVSAADARPAVTCSTAPTRRRGCRRYERDVPVRRADRRRRRRGGRSPRIGWRARSGARRGHHRARRHPLGWACRRCTWTPTHRRRGLGPAAVPGAAGLGRANAVRPAPTCRCSPTTPRRSRSTSRWASCCTPPPLRRRAVVDGRTL